MHSRLGASCSPFHKMPLLFGCFGATKRQVHPSADTAAHAKALLCAEKLLKANSSKSIQDFYSLGPEVGRGAFANVVHCTHKVRKFVHSTAVATQCQIYVFCKSPSGTCTSATTKALPTKATTCCACRKLAASMHARLLHVL